MEKRTTILLFLGLVGLIVCGGVFSFFYLSDRGTFESDVKSRDIQPPTDIKVDITHTEDKFAIGTKEVSRGNFIEAKDGNIYYGENVLPLVEDEVALVCTSQILSTAEEVDYNLSTDVKILTPDTISGNIAKGEPIVVLADEISGILTGHTIAISSEACPN